MKNTFTREEVHQILVGLFIFSGANNNQGLTKVYGETFGEMADHVLSCADKFDQESGYRITDMVRKLSKPVEK